MKSLNFESKFSTKQIPLISFFLSRQLQTTNTHLREFDARRNDGQC
jgi:hypothetical protein